MTRIDLYEYLKGHRLGVLCTVSPAATQPQSALVGIAVTPELDLIFDTVKSSRKYPNLVALPRCSFVIGWEGAQTVQYEGEAEELGPPDLAPCQEAYFKVWPDAPARLSWPGIVYFRVRPIWIRFSDFAQDPPAIEEFSFRR